MANTRTLTITAATINEFAEVAAHFSMIAYAENKIMYIQPAQYKMLTVCPDKHQRYGYYGEAHYAINTDKSVTIIITHRGTILSVDNITDDFRIYEGRVPSAFTEGAKHFVHDVMRMVKEEFPNQPCTFIHAGHSLGAILAELSYAYQRSTTQDTVFSITFENPGSLPILKNAIENKIIDDCSLTWTDHIEIYNADVNIINSCNPQFKTPNWIDVGYTFNPSIFDALPIAYEYFCTTFTKNQHSIVNIYDHFKDKKNVYDTKAYPIGRDAAYQYYMTYNPNAAHQRFWEEAIKYFWNNHLPTQQKYKGDYEQFHDDIVAKLTKTNNIMDDFVMVDATNIDDVVKTGRCTLV